VLHIPDQGAGVLVEDLDDVRVWLIAREKHHGRPLWSEVAAAGERDEASSETRVDLELKIVDGQSTCGINLDKYLRVRADEQPLALEWLPEPSWSSRSQI
jgi:hypothetical protein